MVPELLCNQRSGCNIGTPEGSVMMVEWNTSCASARYRFESVRWQIAELADRRAERRAGVRKDSGMNANLITT